MGGRCVCEVPIELVVYCRLVGDGVFECPLYFLRVPFRGGLRADQEPWEQPHVIIERVRLLPVHRLLQERVQLLQLALEVTHRANEVFPNLAISYYIYSTPFIIFLNYKLWEGGFVYRLIRCMYC